MSIGEQLGSVGQQVAKYMQKSGLMLATVTNINDPDTLGRIKCKPVSEDEDVAETDWCFCLSPAGGKEYGCFFFPNVDDLVVLAFLNGDVHHPLVIGHYWANETVAPYKIEGGKNEISSIKTPKGVEIKLVDTDKKEKLLLTTPSGAFVQIDDEAKSISFQDKEADNAFTLNWEKGEAELKVKKKITMDAGGKASLTMESSGAITIEATDTLTLKGKDVNITANSNFEAEGMSAKVKANGMLTLQASGTAQLKGATVKIN